MQVTTSDGTVYDVVERGPDSALLATSYLKTAALHVRIEDVDGNVVRDEVVASEREAVVLAEVYRDGRIVAGEYVPTANAPTELPEGHARELVAALFPEPCEAGPQGS